MAIMVEGTAQRPNTWSIAPRILPIREFWGVNLTKEFLQIYWMVRAKGERIIGP